MPHNKLFYGDNLEVLRKYIRDETVDLCYIDPPFNSKRNYNQIYNNVGQEDRAQAQAFVDTWTWDSHANYCYEQILDNANGTQTRQSIELMRGLERVLGKGSLFAYLVNMNVRIAEIWRVLKLSGSFYLHCFTPETPVRLANGEYKPICEVDLDDIVVSEARITGRVENCLTKHFSGELIEILWAGVPNALKCTPEHQIFVLRKETVQRLRQFWTVNNRFLRGDSHWQSRRARFDANHYATQEQKVRADELQIGDYCLIPIDREIWENESLDVPVSKHLNAKPVPEQVEINWLLAELCGYYLAEGNARYGYTNWTFHERENDLASRVEFLVREIFGLGALRSNIRGKKAQRITVSSVAVAAFFIKHFGTGSGNKKLPLGLLKANAETQRALFAAWAKGDGFIDERNTHNNAGNAVLRVSTTSYSLAMQMQQVALRLDAVATVGIGNRSHYRLQDNAKTCYRVQVGGPYFSNIGVASSIVKNKNITVTRRCFILNDWLCVPIRALERSFYEGEVFDLHIEPQHSYCAGGVKVSNCDPTASHYLKLICDALFCGDRGGEYQNEIVWQRTNAHNMRTKGFVRANDIIFYYVKSSLFTFNEQFTDYGPEQLKRYKPDETGRLYKAENLTFSSANKSRQFEWRGTKPPPNRSWGASLEQLEKWWEEGRILLRQDGIPRLDGLKVYFDEVKGKPLSTNWTDIDRIGNTAAERLGYPTQKPEALLERIIEASSNEGDTVLDAFCGCGTTIAVAQRLNRQWVGVDITYQSISLILRRLKQISGATENVELVGIPRDMESVQALVHKKDDRVRKEFEKWAVLTYTENRAVINEKRGADRGIDGVAFVAVGRDAKGGIATAEVIFSVKSGKVGPSVMRDLRGTVERENAAAGILITLEEPTAAMQQEAKQAGQAKNEFKAFDKLQIVTVQEILDSARTTLPMLAEIVKKARTDSGGQQGGLFTEE